MKTYTVAFIVDENIEEVLMLRRIKDPYKGLLNGVGGKVESFEDETNAAYREIQEETGLTHKDLHFLIRLPALHFNDIEHTVLHVYYAVVQNESKELANYNTDEGVLGWYKIEDFLDARNPELAGEGNITYFLCNILKLHNKL